MSDQHFTRTAAVIRRADQAFARDKAQPGSVAPEEWRSLRLAVDFERGEVERYADVLTRHNDPGAPYALSALEQMDELLAEIDRRAAGNIEEARD